MQAEGLTAGAPSGLQWQRGAGAVLGVIAALTALTGGPILKISICLGLLVIPLAWWLLCEPNRWLYAFFLAAWLLPPLPLKMGDSGPHAALLLAAAGLFIGVLRAPEWGLRTDLLSTSMLVLFGVMFGSSAIAALYSGAPAAAGSLARVMLFGIAVYAFFYIQNGPFLEPDRGAGAFIRLLFWAATASAAIALVDFYFHFPAPAGYGAQFVWLDSGIFRRAQGFFYEASTLGNLCVFFLDMIAAALLCSASAKPPIKKWMLLCGAVPLMAALVLSYSRASLVSLLAALGALAWIRRRQSSSRQWMAGAGAVCIAAYGFLVHWFPSFAEAYWNRLSNTVEFFRESPNAILSGRLQTWKTLVDFLISHPLHALFGIGYKSLPYTNVTGAPIIADNTYLSTLVETGILGLAVLLVFNFAILKTSYQASRSANPSRAFYGAWMFCFWIGQLIQMFSADLLTYWRVLPAYLCVLALAARSDDGLALK